jgi:hypothetical protein
MIMKKLARQGTNRVSYDAHSDLGFRLKVPVCKIKDAGCAVVSP